MENWQVRHPGQGAFPDSPTLPMTHTLHPHATHIVYNRRIPSARPESPTLGSRLPGYTSRAPVADSLYTQLWEAKASTRRRNPRKNGDPLYATDRTHMALEPPYRLETGKSVRTQKANLIDIGRSDNARKYLGKRSAYAFKDSEADRRSTEIVHDKPYRALQLEDKDSEDAIHREARMPVTRTNRRRLPALELNSSLSDLVSKATLQDEAERTSGLLLASTLVLQDSEKERAAMRKKIENMRSEYWMLQDQYRHYRHRQDTVASEEGKKAMVILPMVNEAFQQLGSVTATKQRLEEINAELTARVEKVCDQLALMTESKHRLEDVNAQISAKLEEMIVAAEQLRATVRAQEEELIDNYSEAELVTADLAYLDDQLHDLEVNEAKIQEDQDRLEAENMGLRRQLSMMDQTETVQAKKSKTLGSQPKAQDEETEPLKLISQRMAYFKAKYGGRRATSQAQVNRGRPWTLAQDGSGNEGHEEGSERVERAPRVEISRN